MGEPVILHGARLYPGGSAGPSGVKHSVRVRPLDRARSRPCGWWMLDESTERRFGLIEGRLGQSLNADGLELDEFITRTLGTI